MPYVYSTATCSGSYVQYAAEHDKNKGHAEIIRKVTINGGHGVIDKTFQTPKGVVTKVTEEELEFLLGDANFQRHMKAGFITVDKARADPEKKAANMAKGDNSAPLTPTDFKTSEHSTEDSRIYTGRPTK